MTASHNPEIDIERSGPGDERYCESILRSLPDWFGIEESIVEYLDNVTSLPTFLARVDGEVLGFVVLDRHNECTLEINVMGVRPGAHRKGIGRKLVNVAENYARTAGCKLLEVKTLGPSNPDSNYAATRAFYAAMGFLPLEELHDVWPGNPCLIMVKVLDSE